MYYIFFLLISLIIILPAYAETMSSYLLEEGQAGGQEEVIVDNNDTVDLTNNVVTVTETTETVGGVDVDLTQETTFVATNNEEVTLTNSDLSAVTLEIPHLTKMSGPETWDKIFQPQITIPTSGNVPSGFQTPTTSILVGSPDNILIFDRAVTITLLGTTGQTAYKLAGNSTWNLISDCSGTYDIPSDPPANGECSISNGVDTKILTFHFTEFSGLSASAPAAASTTSSPGTSGGHGNTGVGSPRIFGPGSSGSSSGGGTYYTPAESGPRVFPIWFDNVKDWYRQGDISALEFLQAYQWIIENILK